MIHSTFHNHSTFCDGKSTVEEMVLAAIEAGQASIGFSGHSHTWFDESYCMSVEGTAAYRAEVARVREKYASQIRVLCGVEQDYFSEMPTDGYDFVIGSVHYVRVAADGSTLAPGVMATPPAQVEAACAQVAKGEVLASGEILASAAGDEGSSRRVVPGENGAVDETGSRNLSHAASESNSSAVPVGIPGEDGAVYLDVDNTEEAFCAAVDQYFAGDAVAFSQAYFAQVADVLRQTSCTFVGHFDLVTKFNEADRLFDTKDPRYREAALGAARALCAQNALFEINTGAMAKGYRETPYPAPFILDELRAQGASVILSADCHHASKLQYALDDSLARGCRIVREL